MTIVIKGSYLKRTNDDIFEMIPKCMKLSAIVKAALKNRNGNQEIVSKSRFNLPLPPLFWVFMNVNVFKSLKTSKFKTCPTVPEGVFWAERKRKLNNRKTWKNTCLVIRWTFGKHTELTDKWSFQLKKSIHNRVQKQFQKQATWSSYENLY